MKRIALLMALSAGFLPAQDAPVFFHAEQIRQGTFTYRDLDHGKEAGRGTITIRKLETSGNYIFSADATFAADFQGFRSQQWEAVATPALAPVSAKLAFVRGAEISPVFDLKYSLGTVTGFATRNKEKQIVHAVLPANIVDQRIDWAAVLSNNLEAGKRFEFYVYDPGTGVSEVTGQVYPPGEIRVPAGTFCAYKIIYQIERAGKTEHYQMLASEDSPHMMLREEFPNGVTSELVRVNER